MHVGHDRRVCSNPSMGGRDSHKYDRYKKQPHEDYNEVDESESEDDESESEDDDPEDVKALKMKDHEEEATTSGSQEKTFIDQWKEAVRDCKESMLNMLDVLQGVPGELRKLDSFKIICDSTRNAMGVREEGVQNVTESQKSMSHTMSNDEIDDPEWINIMIELTKAAEREFILKNRNEFPTFTPIPEYDQTPDENENFNRKKDMEKEKLPEKEMANKAAREEKKKVPEK
ncbi:uncharacterized protein LOC121780410 [Salvia splendens]|uniref:uncharacterized protein LOC121780410 n=1 Tax=Salvia splendens TaxID=180675 RepID=UPI001C256FDA|nr:uncharacterized protein LOC121780410 [Salvia splendens]